MALTLEQARAKLAQVDVPVVKNKIEPVEFHSVFTEARALLDQYDLTDWRFLLSNEKRALGRCYYKKKKIVFSKYFLHIEPTEITDVLKHEVAHALADVRYSERGHGEIWKQVAIEIGARPERCNRTPGVTSNAEPNYWLICPHGCRLKRYRLAKNMHRYVCRQHSAKLTVIDKTGAVILGD